MKLTMNESNKKSFRNSLSLFVKFVVDFIVFNNDFQQIFNTPSLSHFLLNKISLLNTFSATNLDTLVNKIMRSFKLSMVNNYSYSDKECCVAKYCIMYTDFL